MPSFVYKPECYLADVHGLVEKNDEYYMWLAMHTPDTRMMVGNQYVEFRFNTDTMEPTRHMINGKYYTSKKKFRDETKARGCVEVGNDVNHLVKRRYKTRQQKDKETRSRREDIKRAVWELRNGRDIKTEVKNDYHKFKKSIEHGSN